MASSSNNPAPPGLGVCGCKRPAVGKHKSQNICAFCLGIETQPYFTKIMQNDWARKEVKREETLQTQRRYNETRTNRFKLRQKPPPQAPADALAVVAGYALYWWSPSGRPHRAI